MRERHRFQGALIDRRLQKTLAASHVAGLCSHFCGLHQRWYGRSWEGGSPAIDVRSSYRGADVVATLEQATCELGYPKTIRLDNGPEFISRELDLWAFMHDVTLDFSRPGKPTDNAFIESLNGKFRAECVNTNWFMSLDEARRKCEAWRRDYNTARPHSSLGYRTPAAYAVTLAATGARLRNPGQLRRSPVAHTAPQGVSTAEALTASG